MRRVLVVNHERCCGCDYCTLICSFFHEGLTQASKSRVRVYRHEAEALNVPMLCEHCADPPCIPACPFKAIDKDTETGIVFIDGEKCTGCGICVEACPYSAIRMDPDRDVAIICDVCGGDPMCAKGCMADAIRWLEADGSVKQKKAEHARRRKEMLRRILEVW